MIILQFQITDFSNDEIELVPNFCKWLIDTIIYEMLYNKTNLDKVKIRINHLKEVNWINWKSKNNKNLKLNPENIISNIIESFKIKIYKNNIYKIESDSSILIKNSYTSIDRMIRFINSGDNTFSGTNIITNIQFKLNVNNINTLWKIFILDELGEISSAKIITKLY